MLYRIEVMSLSIISLIGFYFKFSMIACIVIILGICIIEPFFTALALPNQTQNTSSITNQTQNTSSITNQGQTPNKIVAIAGSDQTVNSGDIVKLDANRSKDPDGEIVSFSWIQISGPSVVLNGHNALTPSFTAPTVESNSELKFSLTVTDDNGNTSSPSIVTVNVTPVILEQLQSRTSATTNETYSTNSIIDELAIESLSTISANS
jgi:hypothetical protein